MRNNRAKAYIVPLVFGFALLLVTGALSSQDKERNKHLYRSEAILEVEEMGGLAEEEREAILKNLEDRLKDWSVLGSAMESIGDDAGLRRKAIREAVSAELIEDDRITVRFEHEDPVICHAILSALIERIASEGIEDGASERLAFIRAELVESWERLVEADTLLDRFEEEHGGLLEEEKMAGEIARDRILISHCRMESAAAEARKAFLEKRLKKTPEHIVSATVMEYGPEVIKLKKALIAKEEKLDTVRARYGEGPKTAKLERQIEELKLKLSAEEEQSPGQETRSLNPVYTDIEDEILEVKDLIRRLEDDASKAKERMEVNTRSMREVADHQRERRKLERDRDDAGILFKALQNKLEDEVLQERRAGGELRVEVLVRPTSPESRLGEDSQSVNRESSQ